MKLHLYGGTSTPTCARCGSACGGGHVTYADLTQPGRIYYHASCLTPAEITAGLDAAENAMLESMARYYQNHGNRYQGD